LPKFDSLSFDEEPDSKENYGGNCADTFWYQREHSMKKLISVLLLGIAIFTFAFSSPALADAASGAKVFSGNCASCHAGGKNLVQANKSLKKEDLEKYGMYSAEAIISQVTKGKNAMPAFNGRLKTEQIADVAAYVLEQADNGWKK
jgi:cytochrome c6